MRRLPPATFAILLAATVGAFFVTQHLKVTTPLIAGGPAPYPAVINPVSGTICNGVRNRSTTISFYLLHRSDDVDVYVVDQSGTVVRTVAVDRHMRRGVRIPDGVFHWNGTQDIGATAPDGTYHFRIALRGQGRTVDLTATPITVKTVPPAPVVTSVTPSLIPQGSRTSVTIRYKGNESRGGTVRIYRTDTAKPRVVKSFLTPWKGQKVTWDGLIRRHPPPAGTYLVGLDVTDAACNTGHFPTVLPPAEGSTPHAGVSVRYLAAQPPLDPVAAGSRAVVYVDSRHRPYTLSLWRAGARKPLLVSRSLRVAVGVPVPARRAGLYELRLQSGRQRTAVPLVVRASHRTRVLVVLPALTWQGLNPVDEDGDGIPNTLQNGSSVDLQRPLVNGLPRGFADERSLLSYLDASHRSYDLTTDLGLVDGQGPPLAGHAAVVLAGSERWVPTSLAQALRSYVDRGGRLLSLGTDSLLRSVTVQAGKALDPAPPSATDPLQARMGSVVRHNTELIGEISDRLGIFSGTSGAFPGFSSYQPVESVASPAEILSEAGVSDTAPSIVGYTLGHGIVIDLRVGGFGTSLATNVDSQELLNRLWAVLSAPR